jgi:hypothetical protein
MPGVIGVDPERGTGWREIGNKVLGDRLRPVAGDVRMLAQIQVSLADSPHDRLAVWIMRLVERFTPAAASTVRLMVNLL